MHECDASTSRQRASTSKHNPRVIPHKAWHICVNSPMCYKGNVFLCRRRIQGEGGKIEKKNSLKRGKNASFVQTVILEKKLSNTTSSHTACTGRSTIRPCSSSYLEQDFTHLVHFLPVCGTTDQLQGRMCGHEQGAWRRAQGSLTQGDYDAGDKHDSSQDDPGGAQCLIVCRGQNGLGLH